MKRMCYFLEVRCDGTFTHIHTVTQNSLDRSLIENLGFFDMSGLVKSVGRSYGWFHAADTPDMNQV